LRLLQSPSDARLDSNSWQGYTCTMLRNWNLYKEVFYSCVAFVYKERVWGIYRVPRSVMWQKLIYRRCCKGAGWTPHVASRPGLGGEPTSLPQILSCRHMERYSRKGLDSTGYKVGSADRPPCWAHLIGSLAYVIHMVRGWSWWPSFDILWTSPCDLWKAPNFIPSSWNQIDTKTVELS
jgi:hypothetical protein